MFADGITELTARRKTVISKTFGMWMIVDFEAYQPKNE